jgi:hypothetical protein
MSLAISFGNESFARANQNLNFVVTLVNTEAGADVSLESLVISEASKLGATIQQPYAQNAGQPAGSASYPSVLDAATAYFGFSVMCPSPNTPGPSATNPGGAAPTASAQPSPNPQLVLQATAVLATAAGSRTILTTTFTVPVLTAVFPFPVSDVGSAQFHQGGNSNLAGSLAV